MTIRRPLNNLLPTLLTAALMLFALVSTLVAETLVGHPEILDGDTLRFGRLGERVRLEGVDAPESTQLCLDAAGMRYGCGQAAREALKALVGSRPVRCEGSQRGRYGRLIAVCFDADGTDVNGSSVMSYLNCRLYRRRLLPDERGESHAANPIQGDVGGAGEANAERDHNPWSA